MTARGMTSWNVAQTTIDRELMRNRPGDQHRLSPSGPLDPGVPRLPRGDGHEQRADHPQAVEHGARDIGLGERLQAVHAVGHREQGEAGAEGPPEPVGPPALHREHGDQHGDEHQVADGIGEVGGHVAQVADVVAGDGGDDDGGLEGGHPQGGDDAVQPDGPRPSARQRVAYQEADPEVGHRVEEQEEDVLDRRVRHRVLELHVRRPEEVAEGEQGEGDGHRRPPGTLLVPDQRGPEACHQGATEVREVADPAVVEAVRRRMGAENGRQEVQQDQPARREEKPSSDHPDAGTCREAEADRGAVRRLIVGRRFPYGSVGQGGVTHWSRAPDSRPFTPAQPSSSDFDGRHEPPACRAGRCRSRSQEHSPIVRQR